MDIASTFGKQSQYKEKDGYIIIEGLQALRLYLQHHSDIIYLVADDLIDLSALSLPISPVIVTRNELAKLLDYKFHRGVLALAKRPYDSTPEQLVGNSLILSGISSPENVGTLIRSAAAFGVNNIIYDSQSCSPYVRRCIRVSMGNIFGLNTFFAPSLRSLLTILKNRGVHLYGAEVHKEALNLYKVTRKNSVYAVIVGSEGKGIDESLLRLCHEIVFIPQVPGFSSLNVNNAGAIVLSYLHQQNDLINC